MIALLRKEVRELLPGLGLIVACAATLGLVDVAYNWRHPREAGMSLLLGLVIAFAAAFLGGGNALGRETRDHLVFLASWPVPRGTVWLAKLVANLLLAALATAVSMGVCLLLVRAIGGGGNERMTLTGGSWWGLLPAMWMAGFACAFLWGALVRSPLPAAGLGLVTMAAGLGGLSYLLARYLPDQWGPWLGLTWPEPGRDADKLQSWVALGVAAIALVATAAAFSRTPALEARRRLLRGLAWLAGLALAGLAAGLGVFVLATRPSLGEVDNVTLDPTGTYLALQADYGRGPGGVWVLPLDEPRPRLTARGLVCAQFGLYNNGDGGLSIYWVASGERPSVGWVWDPSTRKLYRAPDTLVGVSPSGRVLLCRDGAKLTVRAPTGRVLRVLDTPLPSPEAFGPFQPTLTRDEQRVYLIESPADASAQALVEWNLQTGERRTVTSLQHAYSLDMSPGAAFVWVICEGQPRKLRPVPNRWLLVRLSDGHQRALSGGTYPTGRGWVGSDRFLWTARRSAPSLRPRELQVFDTETGAVVRTIGQAELSAWPSAHGHVPLVANMAPGGDRVFFASRNLASEARGKLLWSANVDGSGLTLLRPETRVLIGVGASGELVLWDHRGAGDIVALNPDNGQERVLLSQAK
jgi:hypothetical protein